MWPVASRQMVTGLTDAFDGNTGRRPTGMVFDWSAMARAGG
jgi:hypothetical protein